MWSMFVFVDQLVPRSDQRLCRQEQLHWYQAREHGIILQQRYHTCVHTGMFLYWVGSCCLHRRQHIGCCHLKPFACVNHPLSADGIFIAKVNNTGFVRATSCPNWQAWESKDNCLKSNCFENVKPSISNFLYVKWRFSEDCRPFYAVTLFCPTEQGLERYWITQPQALYSSKESTAGFKLKNTIQIIHWHSCGASVCTEPTVSAKPTTDSAVCCLRDISCRLVCRAADRVSVALHFKAFLFIQSNNHRLRWV